MRGHVSAMGTGRANCRCDCDGYRPDTLGMELLHRLSLAQTQPTGLTKKKEKI